MYRLILLSCCAAWVVWADPAAIHSTIASTRTPLPTTLLPEAEQVVLLTPAPGAVASWRLQPARVGEDKERNAIRDDSLPWKPNDGGEPPKEMPPGFHTTMQWAWLVERSGFFVIEEPPDGHLTVEADWLRARWNGIPGRVVFRAAIKFSARIRPTQLSELVHVREFSAPSNTSPEKAARLEGVSGGESLDHPGALGLPEDPVGTYKFERFPLWWKFVAPGAGSFQVTEASTVQIRVTDLRGTEFTMHGSVALRYPGPGGVAAVVDEQGPERKRPHQSWPLRAGQDIWVRGCGTHVSFKWKWLEP